jgi:hypothetical protein
VIAAAVLLLLAGGGVVDCMHLLQSSTVPVEKALALFESNPGNSAEAFLAAREVLARAYEARDRLEAARVSVFCAPSRSEELIYLNHLTLGFTGWIAARARRPPGEYDLASIIRRARTHRERGRARLRGLR